MTGKKRICLLLLLVCFLILTGFSNKKEETKGCVNKLGTPFFEYENQIYYMLPKGIFCSSTENGDTTCICDFSKNNLIMDGASTFYVTQNGVYFTAGNDIQDVDFDFSLYCVRKDGTPVLIDSYKGYNTEIYILDKFLYLWVRGSSNEQQYIFILDETGNMVK